MVVVVIAIVTVVTVVAIVAIVAIVAVVAVMVVLAPDAPLVCAADATDADATRCTSLQTVLLATASAPNAKGGRVASCLWLNANYAPHLSKQIGVHACHVC